MKSVNKLTAIIVGVLLVSACSNVAAVDYSGMETLTEERLLSSEGIVSADVSINTQQVTFNCITDISIQENGAPFQQLTSIVGDSLMLYIALVHAVPLVGDLLFIWKNSNDPTTITFSCPKNWAFDVDITNADSIDQLIYKVLMTAEEA